MAHSINKSLLGTTYAIPQPGDRKWGNVMTNVSTIVIDLWEGVLTALKLTAKRLARPFQEVTATGGATTIDFASGSTVRLTLQASTTLTLSNPRDGENALLYLKQDATGGRTISWPSTVKWRAATAPTMTAAANARDVVALVYHAAEGIYLGEYALNFN